MAKIVRGFWDCEFCKHVGIDGLLDKCPNCGAGKSNRVKYYMKGNSPQTISASDVLDAEQLKSAGIDESECDGEHKEWVCPYCGQLNNFSTTECIYCSGNKGDASEEYLGKKIGGDDESEEEEIPKTNLPPETDTASRSKKPIGIIGIVGMVALLLFLFLPKSEVLTVTGHSWAYTVNIENIQDVEHSDWSLPSDAKLLQKKQEIRTYNQVFDHYEDVPVTKSREVFDGYDISYSDNGNGTFSEVQTPRYRTEYYQETEQQAVYRDEPVYDTKYYYTQEEWCIKDVRTASGGDKNPYWPSDYSLLDGERDTNRTKKYKISYDKKDFEEVSEEVFFATELGDQFKLTKNRLGIVYKEDKLP